jgi:hypothetical protein
MILGGLGFYLLVLRRIIPKPVMGSTLYHQTIGFIKTEPKIQNVIGKSMIVMNCNGKFYYWQNTTKFNLIVFGP